MRKSISLNERSRCKQLHIEAPGCIIHICIDLSDADGRPMTYVSVTADGDRYAGDPEWWCDGQHGNIGGVFRITQTKE